jgi:hypothetical protein
VSEHEIVVEGGWYGMGCYVRCSCNPKALAKFDEIETPLQEINAVAMEHLYASYPQRVVSGLPAQIDWVHGVVKVDVPAQGYVHGLDPAEEDPRNGVLE